MPSDKSARRPLMRLLAVLAVVLVPLGVTATIQAGRVREPAPPPPTVVATGPNAVSTSWPRGSRDLSYELSYRPAGSTTWVRVTSIVANQHTIGSLQAATPYEVRLRVRYARSISAWSLAAKVTTTGAGTGGPTRAPQPPNRIRWQGSDWYVSGVNVPWLTWPWAAGHGDFGGGAVDGVVARRNEIATGFASLQASGTHMVRWWTFQQDAWQISRDANGWPTGLNPAVYADFDAALQLAEQYDLYYNFVLFGGPSGFPATWRTNPAHRAQLATVLGPLFARYKDNPRVMAWEIFNEPEWEIWNNGTVVKEADVQAMANSIIYSIRSNAPNTLVTIGSALVGGFNSTQRSIAMWTDVDLDFFSPHWYDTQYSPASICALCTTAPDLQRLYGTTKPFVIGEFQQGSGTTTANTTRLQQWRDKSYAGAWGWSLFPQFTADGFPTDQAALKAFHGQHGDIGPRRSALPNTPPTTAPPTTAPATTAPATTAPATTAPATTAPPTTAPATTVPPTTAPATTAPPTTAPATTAPTATVPPPVAVAPPGNRYSNQALVYNDGYRGHPSGDGTGNFRIVCYYSHMNYDDAIVFPGQPGRAHMHTYFGNTGSNAHSTYDSLRTNGGGSCVGGTANRSSYWVPSVMNSGGQPVVPLRSFQYYKSGYRGVEPGDVNRIPNGLRMIAGTSSSKAAQSDEIVDWYCSSGGTGPAGAIPSCPAGSTLILAVTFPQCWDGVNLDSADHKSHMAYPTYGVGCPATHPVGLPVLTLHAEWQVPATGTSGWRLSSDNYPATSAGGYSAHADFFEAWDPAIRNTFTDICVTGGIDCEGRYLADPPVVNGTTRSAVTRSVTAAPAAGTGEAGDALYCSLEAQLARARTAADR
jgi:hypothetical protein